MGMWDETCGLTNTPILEGNPAVLVLLEPSVERVGFYRGWSFAEQVLAIHKGPYNAYGGVVGVIPRRDDSSGILFHRDVWDACVAEHGAVDAEPANAWRKMAGKPEVPALPEFVAVLNVADSARRDVLSGLRFRGTQEPKGWGRYRFVMALASRHLARRKGRPSEASR